MKNKFALTAGLILLSGLGLAFAGTDAKAAAAAAPVVKQEDAKVTEFKGILFKLVRQDEYLDETIETLDSSKGRLSAHDLSAMGLSLKMIAGNLNRVSALNKGEFATIQPGSRGQSEHRAAASSRHQEIDGIKSDAANGLRHAADGFSSAEVGTVAILQQPGGERRVERDQIPRLLHIRIFILKHFQQLGQDLRGRGQVFDGFEHLIDSIHRAYCITNFHRRNTSSI